MAFRTARDPQFAEGEFENCVVIMSTNAWEGGVRMADRQLAAALSAFVPVLFVDPLTSFLTRRRMPERHGDTGGAQVRRLGPRLARFSPEAVPGLIRPGIASVNKVLLGLQVRHALRRLGGTAYAVIDADVMVPLMGSCRERVSLYWAQDDFVGLAPILKTDPDRVARAERRSTRKADLIIAANPVVAENTVKLGRTAELVPFGCDYDNFAAAQTATPPPEITLEEPYAVFMGQLGNRIDMEILSRVIKRGIRVLFVGPKFSKIDFSEFNQLMEAPNVQWVGEKDFEQLAPYLSRASVGLLPYLHTQFNIGSFPLKTLEYLAAGLPVVATELPAMKWLNTEHVPAHDDPEEFVAEVERLIERGRDPQGDADRRAFARRHTWEARAAEFARILGVADQRNSVSRSPESVS